MSNKENKKATKAEVKAPAKAKTATKIYKEHVQAIVCQTLGTKVSQAKSFELLKALVYGTAQHVCRLDSNKLSIIGIGTFKISKAQPKGYKAGLDKDGNAIKGAKVWEFSPRFTYKPAKQIGDNVNAEFGYDTEKGDGKLYGIYAPVTEEVKAAIAADEAEEAEEPKATAKAKAPKVDDPLDEI